MLRLLTALVAALALGLSACGDDDEGSSDSSKEAEAPAQTEEQVAGCRDVPAPDPKPDGGETEPKRKLAAGKTYEVIMETSCGTFAFELDQKTSPNTAASFASLVDKGFFDGLVFHRIVPGFVIQGGDPTGVGSGGPGYSTRDVPPKDARYVKGVVAMAKSGAEPPGTSGSQFYVVTGADIGLPPQYALLGKVTTGIEVVEMIDQQGDPASGQTGAPLKPVVIEKATLEES